MSKFIVTVEIISRRQKELTIYAKDEEEAESKATNIVLAWDDVEDCEVTSVEEK